jgi:hypothetical protein
MYLLAIVGGEVPYVELPLWRLIYQGMKKVKNEVTGQLSAPPGVETPS